MKPRRKTVQELATAEALLRGHQQVAAAVDAGLIGTTEGFSDVLRAFARHTAPGVWLTTLTIDASGGEMSISGRTLDPDLLPHYIKRLNEEPVMHGRSVASLELERPENEKPYHEFTLRVDARDEIEVAADGTAPDGTAFDRATPGRARPQGAASEGVPPSGTESVTAGSAATATGGSIR
jgi:hypothetical protein